MQVQHHPTISPRRARRLARIEARQARRHRAAHLALALGVGALALLAVLPAASQAQPVTQPATPSTQPSTQPMQRPMQPPASVQPAPSVQALPADAATAPPPPSQDPAMNVAIPAAPPLPPPPPPTNAMVQQKSGPVTYICGGVAADEQQALLGMARSYNMNLLFTQGGRGEYLSDVDVHLTHGGREVASFKADGPRCLVRAPAGKYGVHATYEGRTKTASVSTGSGAVQMRW